jgi:membrane protease YdiL (CAAX protease family)
MDTTPEDKPVDESKIEPEIELVAAVDTPSPATIVPQPDLQLSRPRGIAPIWHTIVLVVGILAFSIWGAKSATSGTINPLAPVHSASQAAVTTGTNHVRLIHYGLTGTIELIVVAWIVFGLRLRKVSFRSLFGAWPHGLNDITKEAGIAAVFWICSMLILVSFAFSWDIVQTQIYKHRTAGQSSNPSSSKSGSSQQKSPQQERTEMINQLMELAPANNIEIAAWGLLCLVVGFSEELIFRGYLQTQCIGLLGNILIGVLLTSIVFGAAHGYQGSRGICLITIYGALFSCLTLLRKNLLPGMLAHSWHDFATGMVLALVRATHLLDKLPVSH